MKRLTFFLITLCFISVVVVPVLVPTPVYAISPGVIIVNTAKTIWEKIVIAYDKSINYIATEALVNAVDMIAQKVAYETAVALATGDRGQGSLIEGKVFQNILKDAAGAAAGDFIGNLGESWEALGVDLCNPDLDVKVSITMSLLKFTQPQFQEPKCDLVDIVKNWEGFISEKKCLFGGDGCSKSDKNKAQEDLLKGLQIQLRPGKSDFSAKIALNDKILAKIKEKKEVVTEEAKQDGVNPKKNTTGTSIETSKENVKGQVAAPLTEAQLAKLAQAQIDAAHPYMAILRKSGSIFYNTLSAKLLDRLINGMNSPKDLKNSSQIVSPFGDDGLKVGDNPFDDPVTRSAIEDYYSEFITTSFSTTQEYNPASEFIICPGKKDVRSINNCVMNPKFYSAFTRGESITVQQAIDLKLLNRDTPLISTDSYLHSDLQYCYSGALCFSNLQKMRLARLIPLGWEIAASKSNVENPVTLGEVIAGFNVSGGVYENLIDPDWILVAPAAQCRAKGPGPILEASNSYNRSEVCVDTQTCLKTDNNGECLPGAWGYCTREKNIWQFGGEQCSSAYASCRSYESDGEVNYYIKDTLDFCTADEVGCQLYSTAIFSYEDDGSAVWDENLNIMLNGQAGTCEGQDVGCSELIKIEPGVNLIYNGSFEIDEDSNAIPDGWSVGTSIDYIDTTSSDGDYSMHVMGDWKYVRQEVDIASNVVYTISVSAKKLDGGLAVSLRFKDLNGEWRNPLNDDEIDSDGTDWRIGGASGAVHLITASGSDVMINRFKRFSFEFVTPTNVSSVQISIGGSNPSGDSDPDEIYFDSVQLEVGNQGSEYVEYGTRNISYIKKAPDYLDCVNNWVPACDNYAPTCEEDELGCNLFIPTSGDPAIPGIVTTGDYCSSDCSGFERYLQENTELDKWFESEDITTYYNFIGETAQSCNLADVGCEAFTNISAGETVEYYKSLRMCVLEDDPNATTYYTWEGSETSGYELRVWNLLKSDVDEGPCTSVIYNGTSNVCNDTVNGIDECTDEDDPACRFYVDENNIEYFRRESKVIKASNSCIQLRRAVDSADMAMVLTSESSSCSEAVVGCKVYRGNDGGNTRRVFIDDFEAGNNGWNGGILSSEAIVTGGHSLKVNNRHIDKNVNIQPGKTYVLSFWTKADVNKSDDIRISFNQESKYNFLQSRSIDFTTEWKQYHLGPVYFDGENNLNTLHIDAELEKISEYFLDNIILKEINSDLYLIRNSWQTPAECTLADLGCDEYEDRIGNIHYLSSFDSLCSESSVGCSMFIDTKNTRTVSEKTWGVATGQNIVTEADEMIYLVDDNQYYCTSGDKGCSELGVPQTSITNEGTSQIDSWESIYLINDPEQYELTLCNEEALGCKAYKSDGQTVYMQDPGERTCTFLDKYEFNGEQLNGWYLTSSVEDINAQEKIPCNDNGELYKKRDDGWNDFVGECTATASGCTEFIDPQGTQGDNLLFNGDFEIKTTASDEAPDFWCQNNKTCDGFEELLDGDGRDGTDGILATYYSPENNEAFSQSFTVNANENYTVNFDLKFIGANDTYLDPLEGGTNNTGGSSAYNTLPFMNTAHAAQAAIEGTYFAGLYCDGQVIQSYDGSFKDRGGSLYRMRVDDSQSSLQDYYTYSGKFRIDSTDSSVNCKVSLGNADGSIFYLDNVSVRRSQSYFYINSSDISGSECNGQVSWEKGCVLTLDTSNIDSEGEVIRQYDSNTSYNQSISNGGNLTIVSGCLPGNSNCYSDSNRIVKVIKNRECSEWLSCRSSSYSTEADGSTKEYCYDLGRCTELSPSGNNCIEWQEKDDEILTEDVYTSRETGWSGQEYSGYSLLNIYNLESLLARTVNGSLKLSYNNSNIGAGDNATMLEPTCRLFPSAESPFSTIGLGIGYDSVGNIITKPSQMPQANFCQDGDNCECTYKKIAYSLGETRFYNSDYNNYKPIDYTETGLKSDVKTISNYKGFWGFCLEYDYSRTIFGYAGGEHPCLTWMPLDILSGEYAATDTNMDTDLGIAFDSMYYCVQAEGNYSSDEDNYESEICTDFVRVESPIFNNFIYGTAGTLLPRDQYYNWYGMSKIDGDIIGQGPIQVEPLGNGVLSTAGTPYSVTSSGEIATESCTVNSVKVCSNEPYQMCNDSSDCSSSMPTCDGVTMGKCDTDPNKDCTSDSDCPDIAGRCDQEYPYYCDSDTLGYCDSPSPNAGTCSNDSSSCHVDSDCIVTTAPTCDYPDGGYYDCGTSAGRSACYDAGGHCFGVKTDSDSLIDAINDSTSTITKAYEYLNKIFYKIVEKFTFNPSSKSYYDETSFEEQTADFGGSNVQIKQVVDDGEGNIIEGDGGITINNKNNEDITFDGNIYNATMKFYAYNESGNQLPLTRLMIDWDDGSSGEFDSGEVSMKNHKNMCVNSCSDSYFNADSFKVGDYTSGVSQEQYTWNVYPNTSTLFIYRYAKITQKDGWNGNFGNDTTRNWSAITMRADIMDNYPNLSAGDYVTLEYEYIIPQTIHAHSIANYWCYSSGYCSQGTSEPFANEGQDHSYGTLRFADLEKTQNGVPITWKRYSSRMLITEDMVEGCYNDNNQSGYCLKELTIARRPDTDTADDESIIIRNVKLRLGCHSNNDCSGTTNTCKPANVGDDLRYCVDDYGSSIGYFSFNHTYICSDPGAIVYPDTRTDACIYQPKIYVEDNWGFCSEGYVGNGDCDYGLEADPTGWLNYNGQIILTP